LIPEGFSVDYEVDSDSRKPFVFTRHLIITGPKTKGINGMLDWESAGSRPQISTCLLAPQPAGIAMRPSGLLPCPIN